MITSEISENDELNNLSLCSTSELKILSRTLEWPSLTVSFFSYENYLRK